MLFFYKFSHYDEIEEKNTISSGIVSADSKLDALEKLFNFFDDTFMSIESFYECEEILTDSELNSMLK